MRAFTIAVVPTLLLACVMALTGCGSAPKTTQGQYCYTDQVIVKDGKGSVASQTVLECTDRPSRQAEIMRAGIDKNCEEFWYPEYRWGKPVQVRGVRCEKLNGRWEIVNINGNTR
jgi:hypothetical protein